MTVNILKGDCRDVLRTLPDESVHCVVTSPPYWGLRDYGVDGQIGLEAHYGVFLETMVQVFGEVRRVLRPDGTLWLNLGDSYNNIRNGQCGQSIHNHDARSKPTERRRGTSLLKEKDLCGIPWRVAFALQADGWYLRQDIIWSKPNPMPESVTDRCTKAHEYLFLLSRSGRYYFDQDAIREEGITNNLKIKMPDGWDTAPGGHGSFHRNGREKGKTRAVAQHKQEALGRNLDSSNLGSNDPFAARNKRSVWTVGTHAFPEAHFATFPPALIEPCILAGCPKGGTVLDPFGGAGTTGLVSDRLGRNAILIELNDAYAEMARKRIQGDSPLFAEVT